MILQRSRDYVWIILVTLFSILLLSSCSSPESFKYSNVRQAQLYYGEDHLTKIKQLTRDGENKKASFAPNNQKIIFQATRDSLRCDAIYSMKLDGSEINLLSSGKGIAVSAKIAPDNDTIIYSSTHQVDYQCPIRPEFSLEYVWPLYSDYDVFTSDSFGGSTERLTRANGYDGSSSYSPKGDKIVFTSNRSGDPELYLMNSDGSNVKQLTKTLGYDGDAVFSPDGKKIVWRVSRPKGRDIDEYRYQLSQGLLRAGKYEIYLMTLATRRSIRLTSNGATNFSPSFDPSSSKVIFSSNMSQPDGLNYDLYTVDINTRKLERITYYSGFDGFPAFSSDGKKLLFTSSRNFRYKAETNIFMVEWVADGIYSP